MEYMIGMDNAGSDRKWFTVVQAQKKQIKPLCFMDKNRI